jgi:hypothetical protein
MRPIGVRTALTITTWFMGFLFHSTSAALSSVVSSSAVLLYFMLPPQFAGHDMELINGHGNALAFHSQQCFHKNCLRAAVQFG